MEEKLIFLLDYQRFQKNHRIEEMLQEPEGKHGEELTEENLSLVNAAGEVWHRGGQECKLMEEWHEE